MKNLKNIKYWLFDLDNTLYSGDTKVFDQVDKKMSKFISDKLNVSIEEAKKIQKNYFHEYNTTLNGMIKNHKIDANEFLEFVHDVDLNFLQKNESLKKEITKLKEKKNPLFLINPKIISKSKNTSIYEEGCLSLPGYFAEIERPAECQIEYIDYGGKKKEMKASGLLATCIQHEVDHLNGILFIDYLSKLKKDMIIKKLVKHKKELNKIVL